MADLILMGYITNAFGLKGGLHIKLLNPKDSSLIINSKIIIKINNTQKNMTISEVIPGNRFYFAEINNRTDAEKLKGAEIYMNRTDFRQISHDEFYLADLIGAHVLLKTNEKVGILIGFSSNNAQLLLEVETLSGYIASIPMVDAIVTKIDEAQKIIIIDPPEGLLEPMD